MKTILRYFVLVQVTLVVSCLYDADFSRFVNKLWSVDRNRMVYGVDYKLAYQGNVPWYDNGRDYSSYPFFSYVNKNVFKKPTYKAFVALLDNYFSTIGRKEENTNAEVSENYLFLNTILNTDVMRETHKYLKLKGKANPVQSIFKQKLYDLWFRNYWRSSFMRVPDSSGFEHVFVGEIDNRNSKVSGFHNWIQFFMEEKKRKINYIGYMKKGVKDEIAMMRFKWYDRPKVIGSAFLGTSPEFEMALYSAVYLMGFKEVEFNLNRQRIKVTCHGINRNRSIGTCYPDIL